VRVLRTPVQAPKANSLCERFGGTLRRECLDLLIPFNERHLNFVLKAWIAHFNHAGPHMSLGPGIPAALRLPAQESALIAIVFLPAMRFEALPFWEDSTMSIGLKKWRREPRMDFLRSTPV
jgi:hypothetical protein